MLTTKFILGIYFKFFGFVATPHDVVLLFTIYIVILQNRYYRPE